MPGGRPTVMTPETIAQLEEVFALDGSINEACFYAGINPDTYYTFVKTHPEYSDRFKALREKPVLMARQTVVKAIATSPEYAFKYLERKRNQEFSLRSVTQIDGNLGLSVNSEDKAMIDSIFEENDTTTRPNEEIQGTDDN